MAVTPAFELPFEYPNATWKRALGSRHGNTGRISYDLPGGQQQAPPALSATVGIVDSSMISRPCLGRGNAAYPVPCRSRALKNHEWPPIVWNSGAGGAFLGVRSIA